MRRIAFSDPMRLGSNGHPNSTSSDSSLWITFTRHKSSAAAIVTVVFCANTRSFTELRDVRNAEEVPVPHDAIEEVHERLADARQIFVRHHGAGRLARRQVDIDDEHPIARVRRQVEALALGLRVLAFGLRREPVELQEVEALDLLRLAVLENLEVLRLESFDDLAVFHRIGVDADEVRAAAEHGALLRLGLGRLRLRRASARRGRRGRTQRRRRTGRLGGPKSYHWTLKASRLRSTMLPEPTVSSTE